MRIYVIFTDEPVFHPHMLRQIILGRPKEIVGVAGVSHRSSRQSQWKYLQRQFGFWGWQGTLFNILINVSRRILDIMPIPRSIKGFHSLASVCAQYHIPYQAVQSVNNPAYLEELRKLDVDIIISSQGQIFKEPIIKLPRLACINRHSALLPAYRGVKPVFWAMLNQEKETGVTIHTMTTKIDEGVNLTQMRIPIFPDQSLYEINADLFEISGLATLRALDVLEREPLLPINGEQEKAKYYGNPTVDDLVAFRKLGLKVV